MKKIGIDARLYFQTGVGVYIRNLISEIDPTNQDKKYFIYVLKQDMEKIHLPKGFVVRPVRSYWHSLFEQCIFLREILADNLDLIHFPYFSYPVLYRRSFIATIHDLTPLLYRTGRASTRNPILYWLKYQVFHFVLWTQVHGALRIITPTRAVKEQLISVFGEKIREKITVTYEGINHELTTNAEAPLNTIVPPFFIYVGNFYPHKNVARLVQAFARTHTKAKLILIGPQDHFSGRVRELVSRLQQQNRIYLLEKASIGNLIYCYRNASALIHPSLSEGFGLPIVEAMYFHLPILASDIPVFKELLANQYQSFDPYNIEEMGKIIESADAPIRRRAYQNMNRFSFRKMAQETERIYHQTLLTISS